jgi:hypothetical protein
MALKIFDIDYDLTIDPNTKDYKELYNEDAINQSIDLWLSHPYRISLGWQNALINYVFSDLTNTTEDEIRDIVEDELARNYQIISVQSVEVEIDYNKRRIYISVSWRLADFPSVAGVYTRFWES